VKTNHEQSTKSRIPTGQTNVLKQEPKVEDLQRSALDECEKIEAAALEESESRDEAARLLTDESWIRGKLAELSVPERLHDAVVSDLASVAKKYHESE